MHMADALLSPAVGGTMWAASAGTIAYCSRKIRTGLDDHRVPLMGVLGAFLFAAQMINFTIPATGSSGHLGGGLLLAILLGPHAAFLTIASVLMVQALFFADGGLLALGCNIFNMGFFPAFVVYPLVYKPLVGANPTRSRLTAVTMLSAVLGLQLGPLAVVLETCFSGISSLPLNSFLLLMQPIHLAIGIVEGLVTVAIVLFVRQARPEIMQGAVDATPLGGRSLRGVVLAFLGAAVLTGGVLSWYASKNPDGLEWAIAKISGKSELPGPENGLHKILASLQERTAIFPDYDFKKTKAKAAKEEPKPDAALHPGTSIAGIVGGFIALLFAFCCGHLLKKRKPATEQS
ncbi:energy-coupling factor ABC transporter permease [Geomonas sp.]|uniref:energy-coupling factor ABC transporter permease n=1 Tax=Geomonas sp. TaxID=2651584 RepID=UPI002B4A7A38|nr:energy-coupling factor ABC transporter permease [Geomonas sp.]HJV34011.1 energy-coupling factor ABC transporter permease [Geomonas sp.]